MLVTPLFELRFYRRTSSKDLSTNLADLVNKHDVVVQLIQSCGWNMKRLNFPVLSPIILQIYILL